MGFSQYPATPQREMYAKSTPGVFRGKPSESPGTGGWLGGVTSPLGLKKTIGVDFKKIDDFACPLLHVTGFWLVMNVWCCLQLLDCPPSSPLELLLLRAECNSFSFWSSDGNYEQLGLGVFLDLPGPLICFRCDSHSSCPKLGFWTAFLLC